MRRLRRNIVISVVTMFVLLFTACTIQTPSPTPSPIPAPTPAPGPESESENPAVIRDRTGRVWDVTPARDIYDMNPDYFNYGLGIGAIPSVDNPTILEEGAPGYPDSDSRTQVFGVEHNGEQRAYSVRALTRHEVFNDIYPGDSNQYVAVTY
jgi:ABC-type Fe3+-hydroxamate transport system substrate-binding protein